MFQFKKLECVGIYHLS